jgi:MFS family permease
MSYQWRAFIVSVVWLSVALSPQVGVPILLPSIGEEFGTSTTMTAWVALAYTLGMAGAFMPATHIGDLLGHKRVAIVGSFLGIAFMLLPVAAPNLGMLIGFRFAHGVVHSLAIANFITLAVGSFPQERRGRAGGLLGATLGVGWFVIPAFVGFVTDQYGWRWVFVIEAGIVLAITLAGMLALRAGSAPIRTKPSLQEFDLPGAVLLMAGITPLLVGVQLLRHPDTAGPWLMFAIAGVLLTVFLVTQSRLEHATLPVHMFKRGGFTGPAANNMAMEFAQGMTTYLLPVFFIQGLEWTATYAGTAIVTMAIARPPSALVSGYLADRFGSAPVALVGGATMVAALVSLALGGSGRTLATLLPFMVLYGISHSMLRVSLQKQMFGAVPRGQLGLAPGVLGLGRHVGMAAGIGVGAALYTAFAGDGVGVSGAAASASDGFRAALLVAAAVVALTFIAAFAATRVHSSQLPIEDPVG